MTLLCNEDKREYIKDRYTLEDLLEKLIYDIGLSYDDFLELVVDELNLWHELLIDNGDNDEPEL